MGSRRFSRPPQRAPEDVAVNGWMQIGSARGLLGDKWAELGCAAEEPADLVGSTPLPDANAACNKREYMVLVS